MSHADSHDHDHHHDDHGTHRPGFVWGTMDRIFFALCFIGILVMVALAVYQNQQGEGINWFALATFGLVGLVLLVGGYALTRFAESHHGQVVNMEFWGMVIFAVGAIFVFISACPDSFWAQARQTANPLTPYAPPVIRVIENKTPTDMERVEFVKFPQSLPADPDTIFVLYEINGPDAKDKVVIPKGMHGKIWYQVKGRTSLAVDH